MCSFLGNSPAIRTQTPGNCPKRNTLQIDNHLTWRNHIDQISPKLSVACYMVRQMYHICNNDTLRSIYFAYFHSIASSGIILWGISTYSRKTFTLQKRIIRIMMGAHPRTSCRNLFKKIRDFNNPKPVYTGCNRRNGPDFGRVFLVLYYTDITQNTYVQS